MDQKYRNHYNTYNTNFNNMQYQYVQPDRFVYPHNYSEQRFITPNQQIQNQQVNYQITLIQEINYYKGMIMDFMKEKDEYIKKEESYKNKIKDLEKIIENNNSKYNVDIEVNLSNKVDKLKSNKTSNTKPGPKPISGPRSGELSEYANILTTIGTDIGNSKKRKNNYQNSSTQNNIFNHRLLNFNYNSEINKNIQKFEEDNKTNIYHDPK